MHQTQYVWQPRLMPLFVVELDVLAALASDIFSTLCGSTDGLTTEAGVEECLVSEVVEASRPEWSQFLHFALGFV